MKTLNTYDEIEAITTNAWTRREIGYCLLILDSVDDLLGDDDKAEIIGHSDFYYDEGALVFHKWNRFYKFKPNRELALELINRNPLESTEYQPEVE